LVKSETLPADGEGMPLELLKPLRDLGTDMGIWWYADYPRIIAVMGGLPLPKKANAGLVDRSRPW